MSFLKDLWLRLAPPLETSAADKPVERDALHRPAPSTATSASDILNSHSAPKVEINDSGVPLIATAAPESKPFFLSRWFLNDVLFIAMLLMALTGVILRLPVIYWVILTPIFGVISIAEGWSHFQTRNERLGLAYRVVAIWSALLLCIYMLYTSGVQGVLNANASSLAMMTLIALGTFVAGIQARVWQICAVGALLFFAVPGVGWLDQSPLLLAAAAIAIILLGGLVLWIKQMQSSPESHEKPPINVQSATPLGTAHRSL